MLLYAPTKATSRLLPTCFYTRSLLVYMLLHAPTQAPFPSAPTCAHTRSLLLNAPTRAPFLSAPIRLAFDHPLPSETLVLYHYLAFHHHHMLLHVPIYAPCRYMLPRELPSRLPPCAPISSPLLLHAPSRALFLSAPICLHALPAPTCSHASSLTG